MRNYLDQASSFEAIIIQLWSSYDCKIIAIKKRDCWLLEVDMDNKKILLYRKIILLSLGLMTLSGWSRVEIEKAITRTFKTYERKEFFKVCRT